MTAPQLASKLTVWTKRKIGYDLALRHAENYLNGTLSDGVVKEFFKTVHLLDLPCKIPACTGRTTTVYCKECTSMLPGSTVVKLLKDLGEFLCSR